jgi:hypothetical protein
MEQNDLAASYGDGGRSRPSTGPGDSMIEAYTAAHDDIDPRAGNAVL